MDPSTLADAYLAGGARILQLRDKSGSSAAFLALAEHLVERAREFGAILIVNDRADVARLSRAGGVHVGQDDLPVPEVRRLLGPDAVVGLSTHGVEQIDAALESDANYVAVGPIFATVTKDTGYSARGLDLLRGAAGRGRPVVAIGGITLERADAVVAAGAAGLAVISDLLTADPEARTRAFIAQIAKAAKLRTL